MFFSFDGIDGAGKSTQMDLFCDWLVNEKGKEVVRCREPGGTPLGEKIRDLLLIQKELRLDLEAEMFLFMASRSQLVREVIRPSLAAGKVVVCDRFQIASVVYQGHAGGLDPDQVRQAGELAVDGTWPDLTFVFHLAPEIASGRVGDETDRIESRSDQFLEKVDAGFRQEAETADIPMELIDATLSIEEIQLQLRSMAESLMSRI
ncbi:MAG: dTMP kinase [Planctomycetota bacterium]|nr:dTMP kinase [Planctomycetota bacterium]